MVNFGDCGQWCVVGTLGSELQTSIQNTCKDRVDVNINVDVFAIAVLLLLSSEWLSVLFGNRKVFSALANCAGLSDTFRIWGGSLFHWFGPDTEKPRRPKCWRAARPDRHGQRAERSPGRCASDFIRFKLIFIHNNDKFVFEPPFWRVRGNVRTSSIARWRARSRLPIFAIIERFRSRRFSNECGSLWPQILGGRGRRPNHCWCRTSSSAIVERRREAWYVFD